jgi:hypothetical protein
VAADPGGGENHGADILVGEVLSRRTAPQRRTEELAKIVKGIPNAEFEVYWIGDEDTEEPSIRQIRRYLRESRAIADQSLQASLLMAMAALEAALTAYAESIDAEVPGSPRRLLEHLFSLGLVSASDHALLVRLYKLRSGIAHAASAQMSDLSDVRAVRSIAERMAGGRYVPVEMMTDWLLDYLLDAGEAAPASPHESLPRERSNALSQLLRSEFPSASAQERQEAVRNLRPASDLVKIYARFKGERIEAEFSRSTHKVTVTSGPLAGETAAPSTMAGRVITSIYPEGNPSRNGWLHFWKTQDGQPIDVYRRP